MVCTAVFFLNSIGVAFAIPSDFLVCSNGASLKICCIAADAPLVSRERWW